MPRLLSNLRIDEISSVDRGAGDGVQVVLMKRRASADDLYTSIDADGLDSATSAYLKREFSTGERESAAESGAALPDGSFPIHNKKDLANAIRAIGRAKDRAKAMAHIKTRARALGATDMLPDTWKSADADARKQEITQKALEMAIASIVAEHGDTGDSVPDLVECFKQFQAYEEAAMPSIIELQKALSDAVAAEVAKMTTHHKAYHKLLDGDEATKFAAMPHDEREKWMKAHPISGHSSVSDLDEDDVGPGGKEAEAEAEARKILEKVLRKMGKPHKRKEADADADADADGDHDEEHEHEPAIPARPKRKEGRKEADADAEADARKRDRERDREENQLLRKRLAALEEDKRVAEFSKRAVGLGLAETDGTMLLKAHRGDPEALKWMEDQISALHKQVDAGGFFKEYGYSGADKGGSAHDQIVAKAQELRKREPKLTAEQAYTKVYEDPENVELARREQIERERKIYGKA